MAAFVPALSAIERGSVLGLASSYTIRLNTAFKRVLCASRARRAAQRAVRREASDTRRNASKAAPTTHRIKADRAHGRCTRKLVWLFLCGRTGLFVQRTFYRARPRASARCELQVRGASAVPASKSINHYIPSCFKLPSPHDSLYDPDKEPDNRFEKDILGSNWVASRVWKVKETR